MRKLFVSLLMTGFLLSTPAMAGPSDFTDPNHPAFAAMKKEAEKFDQSEIKLPMGATVKPNFLQKSLANPSLRARGCNPVVMARMEQIGNDKVMMEVAKKSAVYQSVNLRNNSCFNIDRNKIIDDARNKAKAALDDKVFQVIASTLGFNATQIADAAKSFNLVPSQMVTANLTKAMDEQCMKLDSARDTMFANAMGGQLMQTAVDHELVDPNRLMTVKFDASAMQPKSNNTNSGNNNPAKNAVTLPAPRTNAAPAPAVPAARAPAAVPQQQPQQAKPQQQPAPARNIYQ